MSEHEHKSKVTDFQVEQFMGLLLRGGVLLAALVVIIGASIYLVRHGGEQPHYHVFQGEPSDLRSSVGIFEDVLAGRGRGIIQLGLLLLVATPVVRVAFSVVAFVLERDWLYVVITLVVLGLLLFSLFSPAIA
ncbi:MAG: hypothetical protein BIFFINMI_01542 [Phycisphaerae bacterium]|nr:hypothetical protein [Phycisphaerae bacterium]